MGIKKYEGLTLEKLEKVLKEVMEKNDKKPRTFTAYIPCKTTGPRFINFTDDWVCDNPECKICSSFSNALKELIKKDMGTPEYYNELTSTKDSLKGTTKTKTRIYAKKVEPKEFDPDEAYDREQNRLKQRHYRNQKK